MEIKYDHANTISKKLALMLNRFQAWPLNTTVLSTLNPDWTLVISASTTLTTKLTSTLNPPFLLPQKSTLTPPSIPTSKTTLSVLPVASMLPAVPPVQLLWESTEPLETPSAHGKPMISLIHASEPQVFL